MRKTDRNRHLGLFLALCFLAVGALVITACSNADSPTEPAVEAVSSDTGSSDSGSSDGSGDSDDSSDTTDTDVTEGSLQISMTDAPTDEICNLVVYIADLRVKKDDSPPEMLGIVGVAYDLLELQNGEKVLLGDFEVEQGVYQFIEMHLDESESYVVEKFEADKPISLENCKDPLIDREPLKIPSAKFKINGGPFEVDEQTEVLIDFNAKNSLKTTGNGKTYQLKADVSILDDDV